MAEERSATGEFLKRLGTDGYAWADQFVTMYANKEMTQEEMRELMVAWFCNAIEAGRSAGYSEGYDHAKDSNQEDAAYRQGHEEGYEQGLEAGLSEERREP